MRILVLGGYGNFGARICRGLAGDPALTIIACGRNPAAAPPDFAARGIQTAALDFQASGWTNALKALAPGLVIHCAGPFQQQDYAVALAVLEAGAHYVDLSDGREFVLGFGAALDEAAHRANRLAITGASTLPALSSAIIDRFIGEFSTLDAIDTVIAPGQHAARGVATLKAVLSYAGRPFQVWRNGSWTTMFGWMHLEQVSMPGLPTRLSAVCDVPDLGLFPLRYKRVNVKDVRFRAALEVGIQHRALATLACLRRWGIPLPIARLAPMMETAARLFNHFGSSNGGMTLTMTGRDLQGQPYARRWALIARDNHGPEIPCIPAILLAKRLAAGDATLPASGAMPCMGLLALHEFDPEFSKWRIGTNAGTTGEPEQSR